MIFYQILAVSPFIYYITNRYGLVGVALLFTLVSCLGLSLCYIKVAKLLKISMSQHLKAVSLPVLTTLCAVLVTKFTVNFLSGLSDLQRLFVACLIYGGIVLLFYVPYNKEFLKNIIVNKEFEIAYLKEEF